MFLSSCQSPATKSIDTKYEVSLSQTQKENFHSKLFLRDYIDLKGKTIKTSELKSPIIIVNFWASWCRPCMEEMPSLLRLKKKFSNDKLQIISINTEQNQQLMKIKKVHKQLGINDEFINVADKNTVIADSIPFTTIPVSVIFHNGEAIRFQDGPMIFDSLDVIQTIEKLLE
jgi:thiol-disulfide isomerase/thioredoxin